MWQLYQDGVDLGVRKARNIKQLVNLLKSEFGFDALTYSADTETKLTYTIDIPGSTYPIIASKYN